MTSHLSFRPAEFLPDCRLVRWHTEDGGSTSVVIAPDPGIASHAVPADLLPVTPVARTGSESAAYWQHAHRLACTFVAEGRVRPDVEGDEVIWRIGGIGSEGRRLVAECAAAMPAEARAVPIDDADPPVLISAHSLLQDYLDAVAHVLIGDASAITVDQALAWVDAVDAGSLDPLPLHVHIGLDEQSGEFTATVAIRRHGRTTSLTDVWNGDDPIVRTRALSALREAEQIWPTLGAVLDGEAPGSIDLHDADIAELLSGTADRLSALGVDVHWPRKLLQTSVVLHDVSTQSGTVEFERRATVDGALLSDEDATRLAEASGPLVRLGDRWVLVAPDVAEVVARGSTGTLSAFAAVGAALTGTVDIGDGPVRVIDSAWLADVRRRLDEPVRPIAVPAALDATLRRYQEDGFAWLARMTGMNLGVCLADDMGLGKTITVIALHLHRQLEPATTGATLIVCPASLMGNWEHEIRRFAPGVAVERFHGSARQIDSNSAGFVLTTYGTVLSETKSDSDALTSEPWQLVVADEAQYVKNPTSESARALRRLPARVRVALTGTPVENSLTDLWAVLDWASPGLLGERAQFRRSFAEPIETRRDPVVTERLTRLIRPFVLRRRKTDPGIAPELPPKTVMDQSVSLTSEGAALYRSALESGIAAVAGSENIARRGEIMSLLTSLKKICNHPAHYLREEDAVLDGRSQKVEVLDDVVDTVVAENGAVLVFTQYVAMGRLLQHHFERRGVATLFLHGGTPVGERASMVDRFQSGAASVFLLSLKAGGTGLNLTRADHVVHYDRWWNPAVEAQATDRAHRIGQTKPVQVHRMVTEGTVEERIAAMIADKAGLADSVLNDEKSVAATLSAMSDEALRDFLELKEQQ